MRAESERLVRQTFRAARKRVVSQTLRAVYERVVKHLRAVNERVGQ